MYVQCTCICTIPSVSSLAGIVSHSGIQMLYGKPSAAEAREAAKSKRTLPPPDIEMDVNVTLLCDDIHFDAICSHSVNREYRVYAFIGFFYLEIHEYGLAKVSQYV